jgi:hypothetical protein
MKNNRLGALFALLLGSFGWITSLLQAEEAPSAQVDPCYAEGVKLHNMNRLGEAFDNFECTKRKNKNTRGAEAYLSNIREEMSSTTKRKSEEKTTLNAGGMTPGSPLTVTYPEKGRVKIVLRARYLFDENSCTFTTGSLDVIRRVKDLLQKNDKNQIQLVLEDELDDTFAANDIDADRALAIFALLNFANSV